MPIYHACFWSSERAAIIACDIEAEEATTLLDRFARAGRVALRLSRSSSACPAEPPAFVPTPIEMVWLASICGPAWLFVAANYFFG